MRQGVGALLNPLVAIGPARPDVVLVSRKESGRRGVILTVEPRGYLVQVARTAKDGLGQLAERGGRIGMVVVDGGLADAGRVAQQAVALCPRARLVVYGDRASPPRWPPACFPACRGQLPHPRNSTSAGHGAVATSRCRRWRRCG